MQKYIQELIKVFRKTENKRFLKYFSIGVFTTFLTFSLWNFLLIFSEFLPIGFEERFSMTQYLASFLMIIPSFSIHRYFTFKDKQTKSSKIKTVSKAYIVYIFSPLVASFLSYCILIILPDIIKIEILSLSLGKYFLQFFALFTGFILNYFGQRIWIYQK